MSSSIAALHVAKKQLGLDDDTYRAKLSNLTGKTSAKDMSEAERQKVLTVFRNDGFAPAEAKPAKTLTGRYAKKIQALWIAGYHLGVIRDRRDAALLAFVKRQADVDHTQFLYYHDDATKVIEALKARLKREAGVMFGNTNGHEWLQSDGAKIAWAQWRILHPEACLMVRKGFNEEVSALVGRTVWLADMKPREWQIVMNDFGRRVRAMKGVK